MKSLESFPIADSLQLIRSENVGPVSFATLLNRFGSPKLALEHLPEMAKRGGMKRPYKIAPIADIEYEIEQTKAFGAKFIVYGHSDYPTLLQHIHSAPPILIMRGHSHLWQSESKRCLGIVGSRNASAAGIAFTQKIARECGERGITVISGLARGIDTSAHKGALAHGTVGVIAGGINTLYPPENKALYAAMAQSGAIITEQLFGSSPQAKNFPARNRIIAGMSHGLLVVEAAPKSGSLITARYALEQNREVMAVPNSPMDPRSEGTNTLIKQGATLVQSISDIVLALEQPLNLAEQIQNDFTAQASPIIHESDLDAARDVILNLLSPTPTEIDELARLSSAPLNIIQQILLELELANRLSRSQGGKVAIISED